MPRNQTPTTPLTLLTLLTLKPYPGLQDEIARYQRGPQGGKFEAKRHDGVQLIPFKAHPLRS